jgi:polyhydroxyalkanoate synthesis repressor PhaR
MSNAAASPITIKKYANRRLYNTATSSYVTLDHLCQMVKDNEDFVVYDAKTGEDITRSVLTQIIVEEESKGGQNLLPIPFLRQLIGFYGDQLGGLVPKYLEHSMQAFQHHETQMRQYMSHAFDGLFPFNALEEVNKQNVAFFENAMKMFAPFYSGGADAMKAAVGTSEATIDALQTKLAEVQQQLASLTHPPKPKKTDKP